MADFNKKKKNKGKITAPDQRKVSKKEVPKTRKISFMPVLIFIFSFGIYANTIQNNYALDDDYICMKNSYVQSKMHNVKEIFTRAYLSGFNGSNADTYRPVTILSTAVEVYFFGNNPHRHHLFNILFYSLSCVILFLFLKKVFNTYNIILPFIITLLFAAHPVHTEVVANIKSRDEILCFLFFISALYLMLEYVTSKRKFLLMLSFIFYFLSLLTKENAIPFFILFPLTAYFFTKDTYRQIVIYSFPYMTILAVYLLIRYNVIGSVTLNSPVDVSINSLMASENPVERFSTSILMLGKYLGILVLPVSLLCDYSYNSVPIVNWTDPMALLSLMIFLGSFIYALLMIRRKDFFSFSILFFIISFSTSSNIFKLIGSSMGERFLFTPSLGFCIILGFVLVKICKLDEVGKNMHNMFRVYALATCIVLFYSFKTIDRNKDWMDNYHLFNADIDKAPDNYRLLQYLGSATRKIAEEEPNPEVRNKLYRNAIMYYERSTKILPQYEENWYNMGVCYDVLNEIIQAETAYKKCLQVNPKYESAYNNLGVIFFHRQDYDSAAFYFTKHLQFNPNDPNAISNMGAIRLINGDYENAISHFEKSMAIDPYNINNYNNLVLIYETKKDFVKADFYRQKAEAIKFSGRIKHE